MSHILIMQPSTHGDTAQHSTALHSTAQHGTARHSTARHGTARHSTAQHSTAPAQRPSRRARQQTWHTAVPDLQCLPLPPSTAASARQTGHPCTPGHATCAGRRGCGRQREPGGPLLRRGPAANSVARTRAPLPPA